MQSRENSRACSLELTAQYAAQKQQHSMQPRNSSTACSLETAAQHAVQKQQESMQFRDKFRACSLETTIERPCLELTAQHAVQKQQYSMQSRNNSTVCTAQQLNRQTRKVCIYIDCVTLFLVLSVNPILNKACLSSISIGLTSKLGIVKPCFIQGYS